MPIPAPHSAVRARGVVTDEEARLASAEYYFAGGDEKQATQFALRARSMLDPGSIEWRRAVDIVLASGATPDDLNDLDRRDAARRPATLN